MTSNVRFVAGDVGFYERGFRDYNAAQRTGIALPELDRAAKALVEYFEDDSKDLRVVVIQDGRETALFNSRETQHMRDVKSLMRLVFAVQEVSLVIVIGYVALVVLWAREHTLRRLALHSLIGIGVGLLIVGAIGVLSLVGFDSTWTEFHKLVFANDLWKLDPATDHLIQMFPEPFWQDLTYIIAGLTVAESVLIAGASGAYLLVTRNRQPRELVQAGPGGAPVATS